MVLKEGSYIITYNINLSGIGILFSNKRHGMSKVTNWVAILYLLSKKKLELYGQPKSNIASGQINWVITYDQYISINRYVGEGENYREELQDVREQMLISWRKQKHHWLK